MKRDKHYISKKIIRKESYGMGILVSLALLGFIEELCFKMKRI